VIIVSILLALAADAWWDGVQQRRDELEALTALRADLTNDSVELTGIGRSLALRDSAAAWFLANRTATSVPSDSLRGKGISIMGLPRYQRSRAAYLSLRDGGRLGLIEDDGLRNEIVRYFELDQEAWAQQFSDWVMVREYVIARLSLYGRPLAPPNLATTVRMTDGAPGYDPNWDWQAIRADDELMMLLLRFGVLARALSENVRNLIAVNTVLSTSLEDAF
jgi:hypothetical protein